MKKIFILGLLLFFALYTSYGQIVQTPFPAPANDNTPEEFFGNHTNYGSWVLNSGTWYVAGATSTAIFTWGKSISDPFVYITGSLNAQNEVLTTPGLVGSNVNTLWVKETGLYPPDVNGAVIGAADSAYYLEFQWQNDFRYNCNVFTTTYGASNPYYGLDNATVLLEWSTYTTLANSDISIIPTPGVWTPIWKEETPNMLADETNTVYTGSNQEPIVRTYLASDTTKRWAYPTDANDYEVKYPVGPAFANNGTWWTTRIRLHSASANDAVPSLIPANTRIKLRWRYITPAGIGGAGAPAGTPQYNFPGYFHLDKVNFWLVGNDFTYYPGNISKDIRLWADSITTPFFAKTYTGTENTIDPNLTMIPIYQIPRDPISWKLKGFSIATDVVARHGCTFESSYIVSYIRKFNPVTLAWDPYTANINTTLLGYTALAGHAAYQAEPSFEANTITIAGNLYDRAQYKINLPGIIHAFTATREGNPDAIQPEVGLYNIILHALIDNNNDPKMGYDTIQVNVTQSTMAVDNGQLKSTTGNTQMYSSSGSIFKLYNRDLLSSVSVFFGVDNALAGKTALVEISRWDSVNHVTIGDPIKQWATLRGNGGTWVTVPTGHARLPLGPYFYIARVITLDGTNLKIGYDNNGGSFWEYNNATSVWTEVTNKGNLMVRLNFNNQSPVWETFSAARVTGGIVDPVTNTIIVAADEKFTYAFAAKDPDDYRDSLTFKYDPNVDGPKGYGNTLIQWNANAVHTPDSINVYARGEFEWNAAGFTHVGDTSAVIWVTDGYIKVPFKLKIRVLNTAALKKLPYCETAPNNAEAGFNLPSQIKTTPLGVWYNPRFYSEDDQAIAWSRAVIPGGASVGSETESVAHITGDLNYNQVEWLISPTIQIPPTVEPNSLVFAWKYRSDYKNMIGGVDGVFGGNPLLGFNQADVDILISGDNGASWVTVWTEYTNGKKDKPNLFVKDSLVSVMNQFIGKNIQIAFVYTSQKPIFNNNVLYPGALAGYFDIDSVCVVNRGKAVISTAAMKVEANWFANNLRSVPVAQKGTYALGCKVTNLGLPLDYNLYLGVFIQEGNNAEKLWDSVRLNKVDFNDVNKNKSYNFKSWTPDGKGNYKVIYRLFSFGSAVMTFDDPKTVPVEGYIQDVYLFRVDGGLLSSAKLDGTLLPATDKTTEFADNEIPEHESVEFVKSVPEYADKFNLGGSIGNKFIITKADKLLGVAFHIPQATATEINGIVGAYTSADQKFRYSLSLIRINGVDTSFIWTEKPMVSFYKQPTLKEIKAGWQYQDMNTIMGKSSLALEVGTYALLVNMYPGQEFDISAYAGGKTFYSGYQHDALTARTDTTLYMFMDFEQAATNAEPYYAGKMYKNGTTTYANPSSSTVWMAGHNTDGKFVDDTMFVNTYMEYILEGYDKEGDMLTYSIISKPDWVTLENRDLTKGTKWVLKGTAPAPYLGDNLVIVRMKDATHTLVEKAIKIFVEPTPSALTPFVEEFSGKIPAVSGVWYSVDFTKAETATTKNPLKWVATTTDANSFVPADSHWKTASFTDANIKACVYSDFRTETIEAVTPGAKLQIKHEEYLTSKMIYVPNKADAGDKIILTWSFDNNWFWNSGGDPEVLGSGTPTAGYNNADIFLDISTDFGQTWTAVWAEDDQPSLVATDTRSSDGPIAFAGGATKDLAYTSTMSLEAYQGKFVMLRFRYIGFDAGMNDALHGRGRFCLDRVEAKYQGAGALLPDVKLSNATDFGFVKIPLIQVPAAGFPITVKAENIGRTPVTSQFYVEEWYNFDNSTSPTDERLVKKYATYSTVASLAAGEAVNVSYPNFVPTYAKVYNWDFKTSPIPFDANLANNKIINACTVEITDTVLVKHGKDGANTLDIKIFEPKGKSFTLTTTDRLTTIAVDAKGKIFYFTILDAAGNLLYKSQDITSVNGTTYYSVNTPGEYLGFEMVAGTKYTIMVNTVARNPVDSKITGQKDLNGELYMELGFGNPQIMFSVSPCTSAIQEYAGAGMFYESKKFTVTGTGNYIYLAGPVTFQPVLAQSLSGYTGDWLIWTPVAYETTTTYQANGENTGLTLTKSASSYLTGLFPQDEVETYTIKVKATDDVFSQSTAECAFDIITKDAIKYLTYTPEFKDYVWTSANAGSERNKGGLFRDMYESQGRKLNGAAWSLSAVSGNEGATAVFESGNNNRITTLYTPLIYLPTAGTNKADQLEFGINKDGQADVLISVDGGSTWSTLMANDKKGDNSVKKDNSTDIQYFNSDISTKNDAGTWQKVKLRLDSYAGDISFIRLAFVYKNYNSKDAKIKNIVVKVQDLAPLVTKVERTFSLPKYSMIPTNQLKATYPIEIKASLGNWLNNNARDLAAGEGYAKYAYDNGVKQTIDGTEYTLIAAKEIGLPATAQGGVAVVTDNVPVLAKEKAIYTEADFPVKAGIYNPAQSIEEKIKVNTQFNITITASEYAWDDNVIDRGIAIGSGQSVSYEIITADYLSKLRVNLPGFAAGFPVSFYIQNGTTSYTETFMFGDSKITSEGSNWYLFDIKDRMITTGTLTITALTDDAHKASLSVGQSDVRLKTTATVVADEKYLAIRAWFGNEPPALYTQEGPLGDDYAAYECVLYSMKVFGLDDRDPQSALKIVTDGIWPDWLKITSNTDGSVLLTGTPDETDLGLNPVTLKVTDTEGSSATKRFYINVRAYPKPVFVSKPTNPISVGQLYEYTPVAMDTATTPDTQLEVSVVGTLPAGLTFTNGKLSGKFTAAGEYTIRLQVSKTVCTKAITTMQEFDIDVFANVPPEWVAIHDYTTYVGAPNFSITLAATDQNMDPLTISLDKTVAGLTLAPSTQYGKAVLSGSPTAAFDEIITASVTDGINKPVTTTFKLTVKAAGTKPTIEGNKTVNAVAGSAVSVLVTATATEGDPITFSTVKIPTWANMVAVSSTSVKIVGVPGDRHAGDNVVTISATDKDGTSYVDVTIKVTVNTPPSFSSDPKIEGAVGTEYSYDVVAKDGNSDRMTITAVDIPMWMVFEDLGSGKASLKGTPSISTVGNGGVKEYVKLKVSDGKVDAYQTFWITIAESTGPAIGIADGNNDELSIYPNPVINILTVKNAGSSSIEIVNVLGQKAMIFKNASIDAKLNVQTLKPGTYMIRIMNAKGTSIRKFIKE